MTKALHHIVTLSLLSLTVALPYSRLSNSYFCSFDDFTEVHRAAFEDSRQPSKVFSTSHFGTEKYRPLNRWLNLETYRLGAFDPHWFRVRNTVFHVLNVCLVYALGFALFRSLPMAAAGALLFGLHPLTNQAVVGAVMTNATAATLALAALLVFVKSGVLGIEARASRLVAVTALTICGTLFYEADIAVCGIMVLFLALSPYLCHTQSAGRRFWVALLCCCTVVIGLVMLLRAALGITKEPGVASLPVLLKNACMYLAAILLPIDPLLANKWFGTPMPQDLRFKHVAVLLPVIAVIGIAGIAIRRWLVARIRRTNGQAVLFLVVSAVISISPLLLFNSHPSETYLYLPMSFVALLFAYVSGTVLNEHRAIWMLLVAAIALVAELGTMNRIQEVAACGNTARNILSEFAEYRPESNAGKVLLAKYPGEPASNAYGMYGHRGLDAIGMVRRGFVAIPNALQLETRDESLEVRIPVSDNFLAECETARAQVPGTDCFWVHVDGHLEHLAR